MHLNGVARYEFNVDDAGRVVARVAAGTVGIGQHGSAQGIVRVHVGAPDALVDHVGEAHIALPLHVHAYAQKHRDDTRVLADGALAFGAHARVDQYLRHGVFRRGIGFPLVGIVDGLHEVDRMVVGNELQRVRHAVDQVTLANQGGHDGFLWLTRVREPPRTAPGRRTYFKPDSAWTVMT